MRSHVHANSPLMLTRRWRHGLALIAALGLLTTACVSPSSDPDADRDAVAADELSNDVPTSSPAVTTQDADDAASPDGLGSTSEIAAPGGAHAMAAHVPVTELPEVSDVAVRARVTHISTGRLNTTSGSWAPPEGATAEELHRLYSELTPLTEITLTVNDVLGVRPSSSLQFEPGDTVAVTVLGGEHPITLTAEQARKIGVTVPTSEPDGTSKPPDGPLDLRVTMAPAVDLAVGDDVVAFLNHQVVEFYPGPTSRDVVVSVRADGWGIYKTDGSADRRVNAASGREVATGALENAAESLDRQDDSRRPYTG